jgi:hypothetical protein
MQSKDPMRVCSGNGVERRFGHRSESLVELVQLHGGMGSFDSVRSALRELLTALRMTVVRCRKLIAEDDRV